MQGVGAALEEAAERLDLRGPVRRDAGAEQRDDQPLEAPPVALGEAVAQVGAVGGASAACWTIGPTAYRWGPRE